MAKRTKSYCNSADLTAAIVQYQKECNKSMKAGLPQPQMPKYIGECIYQICNRLTKGKNFNFASYTPLWREEMVADAIERCVYAIRKFNVKKSKTGAFSYLTTVAIHAQKKRINDEKEQHAIFHKNFQQLSVFDNYRELQPDAESIRVVAEFEEKRAKKKLLTTLKDTGIIKKNRRK